jgi:tetratricopeptide (TPR) repeat protein
VSEYCHKRRPQNRLVLYMMNRLNLVLLCLTGWWIAGCKNQPDNPAEAILTKAPFASITDSIRSAPQQGDYYLIRAVRLSQNNLHELATEDYKKAWELQPSEGTALQYISNLLLVDEAKEAVRLLKSCIRQYPNNTEFQRRLSEVYAQVGASEEALEQYDQLLAKDSLNFETWFEKGTLLVQLKDTPQAIQAMERSYQLQPINYTGLALANLYGATLNPKVLPLCDTLMVRDTTSIKDALFLKGTYFSDTKQYKTALELFEECIKRDWKFTDAHIEKGIVLYEQKQYNPALEAFVMAATVSNTSADAYYWMARCFEATGKRDEALQNYQRAFSLDKGFTEARDGIRRLRG